MCVYVYLYLLCHISQYCIRFWRVYQYHSVTSSLHWRQDRHIERERERERERRMNVKKEKSHNHGHIHAYIRTHRHTHTHIPVLEHVSATLRIPIEYTIQLIWSIVNDCICVCMCTTNDMRCQYTNANAHIWLFALSLSLSPSLSLSLSDSNTQRKDIRIHMPCLLSPNVTSIADCAWTNSGFSTPVSKPTT